MVSGRRILLLAPQDDRGSYRPLEEEGFTLSLYQEPLIVEEIPLDESPDLVVVDIALMPAEDLSAFLQRCKEVQLPVLAVVSQEHRSLLDPTLPVEDFIFSPLGDAELRIRVRHILWKTGSWDSGQVVRIGDLLIDQERYEISVAGRRVILTYKEYQLLCLLATNPGRVYSREALLSRVWGYDYFGGTRTVDVHIRRLRSKVEDATERVTYGQSFWHPHWNCGSLFCSRSVGCKGLPRCCDSSVMLPSIDRSSRAFRRRIYPLIAGQGVSLGIKKQRERKQQEGASLRVGCRPKISQLGTSRFVLCLR